MMRKTCVLAFTSGLIACTASSIAVDSIEAVAMSLMQVRANSWSNASIIKPHIVFVLADDLGWNGVGYNGGAKNQVKTPFIDKLAKDGVRLNAYYAAAYCAPSRFAFLTGRAPWKSESGSGNFRNDAPIGTSTSYLMLPAALKKAGYDTHLVGKWHQGFHMDAYLPTNRGFDTFYGIGGGCTRHFNQKIFSEGGTFECRLDGHVMKDIWEDDAPDVNYTQGDFGDDLYRDRAVQLIKAHDQKKPFFLYLSLQAPHEPYEVPDKYASKYHLSKAENVYWGMHSHVDGSVETVYHALQEAKMWDNTIFVFTSDNGGNAATFKEPYFSNYPLRGHKGQLYDGALRVPCFVHGGALPSSAKGKELSGLMGVEDWYATLGHISGAEPHNGGPWPHDSLDNWKYIIGGDTKSARKEHVHHFVGTGIDGKAVRMSILRNDEYKFLTFGAATQGCDGCKECTATDPCVYKIVDDPGETTDVSNTVQDMVKNYVVPRMDETWNQAYLQAYFGTGDPGSDKSRENKACNAFKKVDGYVTTWATSEDEKNFMRREFAKKKEMSSSSLLID